MLIFTVPERAIDGMPEGGDESASAALSGLVGAAPFMLTEEPTPEPEPPREAGMGIFTVSVFAGLPESAT